MLPESNIRVLWKQNLSFPAAPGQRLLPPTHCLPNQPLSVNAAIQPTTTKTKKISILFMERLTKRLFIKNKLLRKELTVLTLRLFSYYIDSKAEERQLYQQRE